MPKVERELDVLLGRERGQEIEVLEDDPKRRGARRAGSFDSSAAGPTEPTRTGDRSRRLRLALHLIVHDDSRERQDQGRRVLG
jgi:hypothetical protein